MISICFFFNDTATTEIYTLSLHDALPILPRLRRDEGAAVPRSLAARGRAGAADRASRLGGRFPDRKSTRLNSSHANISYAVFCLKKKIVVYTVPPVHHPVRGAAPTRVQLN